MILKNKICPFCGALIADDSYFCDQCGKQLSICPKCHEYGKGKFCKHCGTAMVPVTEEVLQPISTNEEEPIPVKVSETPSKQPLQKINMKL